MCRKFFMLVNLEICFIGDLKISVIKEQIFVFFWKVACDRSAKLVEEIESVNNVIKLKLAGVSYTSISKQTPEIKQTHVCVSTLWIFHLIIQNWAL